MVVAFLLQMVYCIHILKVIWNTEVLFFFTFSLVDGGSHAVHHNETKTNATTYRTVFIRVLCLGGDIYFSTRALGDLAIAIYVW